MVTTLHSNDGSNLEFPLSGHDFSVRTADLNSSVQAASVVGFNDVTAVDARRSDAAVVRSLLAWEGVLGPAKRIPINIEKRLKTKLF